MHPETNEKLISWINHSPESEHPSDRHRLNDMVHTMIINGDCIDEDDLYKVIVIYKPEWDKKYIEEFMNIYLNKIWTVTSYVGYLNDDPSRFDDIVGSEAY